MASRNPITKRSATPTGPYHQLIKAIKAAGASEFCSECYAHVAPGHGCPDWRALGLPVFEAPPAVVTFEGELTPEPAEVA